MSSETSLTVDGFEIFSTRSFVDPVTMTIFNEHDRRALLLRNTAGGLTESRPILDPEDLELWMEVEQGEARLDVSYAASAAIVRDRLHVMGFSLDDLKVSFERARKERLAELNEYKKDSEVALSGEADPEYDLIESMSFYKWLELIGQILASGVNRWDLLLNPELADRTLTPTEKYLLDQDRPLFGFDLGDPRHLLRAALERARPDSEVRQDLSEVVSGGYYQLATKVAESSRQDLRSKLVADVPTVVLTEGRTDSEFLGGALGVLLPHLTDYYTFLDFESVGAMGGAGPLVGTVKSFVAASIANRVVAIFDNDTAAASAIRSLQRVALPGNVRVLQLPPLPLGLHYPTLGPTGYAEADVNGSAGSIELYFGEEVLKGADGKLTPVVWRTYDPAVGRYQGELEDKGRLQDAFRAKLRASRGSGSPKGDWAGMSLILSRLVNAFAPHAPLPVTTAIPKNPNGNIA